MLKQIGRFINVMYFLAEQDVNVKTIIVYQTLFIIGSIDT